MPSDGLKYGSRSCCIPEVRNDLVTTIRLRLVLLRGALGDLELVLGVDGVAGVGASTDLAAVVAVAENLPQSLVIAVNLSTSPTYASVAVALHLVTDVAAHTSSGRHLVGLVLGYWGGYDGVLKSQIGVG
jgi:hypothetical protein